MSDYEKLAVAHALAGAVKDVETEAREACNKSFLEDYDDSGVEKRALKVGGEKVGEFAVVYAKESFEVTDGSFMEFALANGLAHVKASLKPDAIPAVMAMIEEHVDPDALGDFIEESTVLNDDWDKFFEVRAGEVVMAGTNEVVPGITYRPKHVKGTRITGCRFEDVAPRLTTSDVTRLLGAGDE